MDERKEVWLKNRSLNPNIASQARTALHIFWTKFEFQAWSYIVPGETQMAPGEIGSVRGFWIHKWSSRDM